MAIGYLYLALIIFTGLTKGFCGKKTSSFTTKSQDAFFVSVVRMLICTIIGLVLTIIIDGFDSLKMSSTAIILGLLSGLFTSIFVVSWLLTVKGSAYMLVDVVLTISTLIPILLSVIFFNESVHYLQIIGFVLLVVAVLIMASYNNSIKSEKLNFKSLILLVGCGLANGFNYFVQKCFSTVTPGESFYSFNFYTYLSSTIVLAILFLVTFKKRGENNSDILDNDNQTFTSYYLTLLKKIIGFIVIMAVCLFLNSFFSTLAASILPSTLQFPLQQGLNLSLSLLMSAIFFKEKITIKSIIGIVLTFVALIFINLLPSLI